MFSIDDIVVSYSSNSYNVPWVIETAFSVSLQKVLHSSLNPSTFYIELLLQLLHWKWDWYLAICLLCQHLDMYRQDMDWPFVIVTTEIVSYLLKGWSGCYTNVVILRGCLPFSIQISNHSLKAFAHFYESIEKAIKAYSFRLRLNMKNMGKSESESCLDCKEIYTQVHSLLYCPSTIQLCNSV